MTESSDDTTQPFAKPICSICYEDLEPILEDLQALSICGHVFHELCIQQWFEYCSKEKKQCPICKQTCAESNVSRLYFQSVGDSNDSNPSQKLQTHKEDPKELKLEVRRLEQKVNMLNSALESRENDFDSISNELSVCKEKLKKEASLKNETLEQTSKIDLILDLKKKDLVRSDNKCKELQKQNLTLDKQRAALKLVSDVDLKEDRIVELASLGTDSDSKETVDILRKSLGARKKLYENLMEKYIALGRCVGRSHKELEKAKEQLEYLEKVKKKIQKLETAKEMKANEVLRALNASNKAKKSLNLLNGVNFTLNHLGKTKRKRLFENINESNNKDGVSSYILVEDDAPKVSVSSKFSSKDSVPQPTKRATDASYISKNVHETSEHNGVHLHDCKDDDMVFVHEPLLNIRKEASSPHLNSQEATDSCFSNGLLDGTKRHQSKWCRNGQSKASGDFIAEGPDGRGGTIKVSKSHNLSALISRRPFISAKSGKIGAKASSFQSRGSLRIDQYFSKADQ